MEQAKEGDYSYHILTSLYERDLVIAREEIEVARYLLASEILSKVVCRERNHSIFNSNSVHVYGYINELIFIILLIYKELGILIQIVAFLQGLFINSLLKQIIYNQFKSLKNLKRVYLLSIMRNYLNLLFRCYFRVDLAHFFKVLRQSHFLVQ